MGGKCSTAKLIREDSARQHTSSPCMRRTIGYRHKKSSFCNSYEDGWSLSVQSRFGAVRALDQRLDTVSTIRGDRYVQVCDIPNPWRHFRGLEDVVSFLKPENDWLDSLFCHKWARKIWIKLILRVGILPCLKDRVLVCESRDFWRGSYMKMPVRSSWTWKPT